MTGLSGESSHTWTGWDSTPTRAHPLWISSHTTSGTSSSRARHFGRWQQVTQLYRLLNCQSGIAKIEYFTGDQYKIGRGTTQSTVPTRNLYKNRSLILPIMHSVYYSYISLCFWSVDIISILLVFRVVLRDMDGLTQLVAFIGNSEYADLHVFAVMVLSNCLEDLESIEVYDRRMLMCCVYGRPLFYNKWACLLESLFVLSNYTFRERIFCFLVYFRWSWTQIDLCFYQEIDCLSVLQIACPPDMYFM